LASLRDNRKKIGLPAILLGEAPNTPSCAGIRIQDFFRWKESSSGVSFAIQGIEQTLTNLQVEPSN